MGVKNDDGEYVESGRMIELLYRNVSESMVTLIIASGNIPTTFTEWKK